MASEKQIEANRRNAQLSTGPRTEEGKAAVATNALTHGLRALQFHGNGDSEIYNIIFTELAAEHQPQTASERIYLERMALAQEQLCILEGMKYRALNSTTISHDTAHKYVALYWQAQDRLERAYDRASDRLRKLQQERTKQTPAPQTAAQPEGQPKDNATPPSPEPSPQLRSVPRPAPESRKEPSRDTAGPPLPGKKAS